jgi:hypothetical protein
VQAQVFDPVVYLDEERLQGEFVSRFYDMLTHSITPPYAISLDGLWGVGKTAIMRRLQEQLAQSGYPVFWYNPWKYRQTQSVVLAFLQSLYLSAADQQFFPDVHRTGATLLHLLVQAGMDAGLKFLTQAAVPSQTALATINQDPNQIIIREFAGLLQTVSRHHRGKPVIIFIDDLDRCRPADVLHFLQAMQHLFLTSGSRGIFICGIDTHLARQYLAGYARGAEKTERVSQFFRKIFPLTLSMPYSANIKRVLRQYITSLDIWDDPDQQKAGALARMVYIRGLQSNLSSIRQYFTIVTECYTFLTAHPDYEFQFGNDFIANLFIIKTAWPALYLQLMEHASARRVSMSQMVQRLIQGNRLRGAQEKFLTAYFGYRSPFAGERLAAWLARYPLLGNVG